MDNLKKDGQLSISMYLPEINKKNPHSKIAITVILLKYLDTRTPIL